MNMNGISLELWDNFLVENEKKIENVLKADVTTIKRL